MVNSAKKNLHRYRFQTFTIVNCAPGSNFWGEINLGAGPHGGPKNLFLAQEVLETSSFHCLLQNIFLILKCAIVLESDPLGGLGLLNAN